MQDLLKKLLWVLALSLTAHLILLFGPRFSLPVDLAPAPALEARLEKTPPPTPAQPETPKPAKPPHRAKPKPHLAAKPAAAVRPAEPEAPSETPVAETRQQAATPAPAEPEAETAETPAPAMPQRVTIKFTVFKGLHGLNVGRAEQSWQLDGERYTITSVAQATGLFSLFASGRHIQESHGEIVRAGLKPSSFRAERGQGADKTDTARFDWNAMTLTLASGGDSRTLKLEEGTQDLLSMMYQLAFAPPQQSSVRMRITNGRKLDSYSYWVVEEALDTRMGRLNTLHLGKQREDGDKDTEIWLAADYHYLPVKISQLDKDGDGLVLLANDIDIKP
ncbi:MAG: DUF3108 domain-containing protein [Sulfuricella sp.]|nr:DUF3108 domain-containing protein [Sulfuricella sp.]